MKTRSLIGSLLGKRLRLSSTLIKMHTIITCIQSDNSIRDEGYELTGMYESYVYGIRHRIPTQVYL